VHRLEFRVVCPYQSNTTNDVAVVTVLVAEDTESDVHVGEGFPPGPVVVLAGIVVALVVVRLTVLRRRRGR
jgi:hypothetical protein